MANNNTKQRQPGSHQLVDSDRLSTVLERHSIWIGSGWEIGQRADLHGVDLHRVDLHGAVLESADLHRADLHDADLSGADLRSADLHGADLHRAMLDGADLREADLRGANLTWVWGLTAFQLEGAYGDDETQLPDGLSVEFGRVGLS